MKTLSPDTSVKAEELQIAISRTMPAWKKIALMNQLNADLEFLARHGLIRRYPNASARELQWRMYQIKLGSTLTEKVYGTLEQWMNHEKFA